MISESGNIYVDYANRADQGLYVLHINIDYSGDYRAGKSMYRLFGCALGDTSTNVHYKLMNYGFQTISLHFASSNGHGSVHRRTVCVPTGQTE